MGGLSDRIGRRKGLNLALNGTATILWAVIIYTPGLSLSLFVVLGLLTGLCSSGMIIGFAFCKESVPAHLSGNRYPAWSTWES